MSNGRKITTVLLFAVLSIAVFFTACTPPEIEGVKVNLQSNMFNEAHQTALKAVELYPNNTDAWYYLGQACYKKNLLEDMVKAFNKSLEIAPTHKAEINSIKRKEFVSAYNYAIKLFNAAQKEVDIDKQKKMREEMVDKFTIAKICDDEFFMSYILLAKANIDLGKKDEGIAILNEAENKFSKKDTVLFNIGNVYLELRDFDNAKKYYTNAYEINKNNSDVVLALSDILMREKDFKTAKSYLEVLLEKKPNNVKVLYNIAAIYYNLKDYKQSANYFEQVINIENDNKLFWEYYAQALFNGKMFEKAIAELSQAVEIITDSKMLYEILSFSYTRTGNAKKAKEMSKIAESLNQ